MGFFFNFCLDRIVTKFKISKLERVVRVSSTLHTSHFHTFTLSLSHFCFHFHTFTFTLSLSHFHFHTFTFTFTLSHFTLSLPQGILVWVFFLFLHFIHFYLKSCFPQFHSSFYKCTNLACIMVHSCILPPPETSPL